MKSEPDECSITDLEHAPGARVPWIGVRNYQARNFMRDAMRVGDGVLFYHSSCAEPGVAGLAEVAGAAYPDASQFDPASPYFDAKSSVDKPRWLHVDVRHRATTPLLSLKRLRERPEFATMQLLKPGSRLSITPVTPEEWRAVTRALVKLGADPALILPALPPDSSNRDIQGSAGTGSAGPVAEHPLGGQRPSGSVGAVNPSGPVAEHPLGGQRPSGSVGAVNPSGPVAEHPFGGQRPSGGVGA